LSSTGVILDTRVRGPCSQAPVHTTREHGSNVRRPKNAGPSSGVKQRRILCHVPPFLGVGYSWWQVSRFSSGGVTMVRSLSGLNGVLGPLAVPTDAFTVNGVAS